MPLLHAESLREYVDGGGYATLSERMVYTACVVDGLSRSRAALVLGVDFETVRFYLRRLRDRARHPERFRGKARLARAPRVMTYTPEPAQQ